MENTNKNDGEVDLQTAGEWLAFGDDDQALDTEHELSPAPHYEELSAAPVLPEIAVTPVVTISAPSQVMTEVSEVAEQSEEEKSEATLSDSQVALIRSLVEKIETQVKQIKNILEPYGELPELKLKLQATPNVDKESDGQVVEGIFDGQAMIGPDGHEYAVPANYASKSRLVDGDVLKLVISRNGNFIFKQIQPVDRRRVTGILEETESGDFFVMAEDRRWRVLAASVTYYKGESGDQTVIVIPRVGMSKWAAVENIIKR